MRRAACAELMADCDGKRSNGCEQTLGFGPLRCLRDCMCAAKRVTTCEGGRCGLVACDDHFADCDGDARTGCGVNIRDDDPLWWMWPRL